MDGKISTNAAINLNQDWANSTGAAVLGARAVQKVSKRLREVHLGDRIFLWILRSVGISVVLLLAAISVFLLYAALPAIREFGWNFIFRSTWDPVKEVYGALPVIFGTVVSSLLAIAISTPVSLGIALFLNELSPRRPAAVVGFLVEMLAAIPSVVYGLWGIFILTPWLRNSLEPALGKSLGFLPLFEGPYYGTGMLAAGLILGIMVTPTISSICREVFRAIPRSQREAALALGATRWEMMRLSVIKSSKVGIVGAVILGLGRALGETMAVTMVIGNRADISLSLFAQSQTMASVIANQYTDATTDLLRSALAEIGLTLFAVSLIINAAARFFVWRVTRTSGRSAK
jgi:phosphate transport system permease protein